VRTLADGRVYTSEQAAENGLIDEIGYEERAVEAAKRLAGLEQVHLVRYSRRPTLRELLLYGAREPGITLRLRQAASLAELPRLMYLWQTAAGPTVE
jgi:protease-4